MVTLSEEGFIKHMPMKNFQRSSADPEVIDYREGDRLICQFETNTLNQVYIFTNLGNMFQIESQKIPEFKWREKGDRFDDLIRTKMTDGEKVVSAFSLPAIKETMIFKFLNE